MDDAGLARRLQAGDAGAWAEVYDRYADRLHDHCTTILRDRHEAEDALHDAFVTAGQRIGQLRDPERLRPWLYAICRTTALTRARRRSRVVPSIEVGEMSPAPEVPDRVAAAELQQLVWDAAEGLPPQDRAVLDLHLRQGLVGQDLADALDVTPHHAAVRLSRVRDLVERSLTVLLVGRVGRRDCPDLDVLLAGWDGRLDPRLRKRVARHIDGCEVCDERRRTLVSPLALLAAAPLVPAPAHLRARVLASLDAGPPSPPPGPPPRPRAGRRRRIALVAGAAVAALLLGTAAVTALGDDGPSVVVGPTTTEARSTTTTAAPTSTTPSSVAVVPGPTTTTAALAAPAELDLATGAVHLGPSATTAEISLRNTGERSLRWEAGTDLAGATLVPDRGRTEPGAVTVLVLTLDRGTRPEGGFVGVVTVAGRDADTGAPAGSGVVTVDGSTERAPTLAAVVADRDFVGVAGPGFCRTSTVTATVADESPLEVVLHWSGGGVGTTAVPMTDGAQGWTAVLGPPSSAAQPITWWIVAVDERGNERRSGNRLLPVEPVC